MVTIESLEKRRMAHKQILFHSAAREKILRGATLLADAVRVTLGPKSKSVLIQKSWGAPIVCNDGVTIAKEIDLRDPEEISALRFFVRRRRGPEMSSVTAPAPPPSLRMRFSPTASAMSSLAPAPSISSVDWTAPHAWRSRRCVPCLARSRRKRRRPRSQPYRPTMIHQSALSLPTPSLRSAAKG